jgi:hypothetical protein
VADRAAWVIANAVYGHLTRKGTTRPDTAQTAIALHRAVRDMRARHVDLPSHWAGHIHTGGSPLI